MEYVIAYLVVGLGTFLVRYYLAFVDYYKSPQCYKSKLARHDQIVSSFLFGVFWPIALTLLCIYFALLRPAQLLAKRKAGK